MEKEILKYTLKNAIEHKGKADEKAIIGKIFKGNKNVNLKEVLKDIKNVVKKVNSMSLDEQKEELKTLDFRLLKKEKIIKEFILPELKTDKKIVMRFAPNPNGAMSLGHSRIALLNWFYVELYKGKYILRFDDTDPKNKVPLKKAYRWFVNDMKWMGIRIDKKVIQSKRLKRYYRYAKKLIDMGKAYVCTCDKDDKKESLMKKMSCNCRDLSVKEVSDCWKKMLKRGGYKEGEAVLRIKTDLENKNPAVRDWPAFRVIEENKHPFNKRARVWPLLNFASAIDDYVYGITHIIRGVGLKVSDDRQKYMYNYFGWEYPKVILVGKLYLKGIGSTTQAKEMIESKELSGWDDPRLGTIIALKRRGFQSDAISEFIRSLGLNKSDVDVSIKNLIAFNKKILEKKANRYFFIEDPKLININNVEKMDVDLPLHPDFLERGVRKFKSGDEFYVSEELKKNSVYRLIGLFNFKNNKFFRKEYTNNLNAKLIEWLTKGKDIVKVEVVMEDNTVREGVGEGSLRNLKVDDVVQFVRFGFCRFDEKKKGIYRFYFCHK